MFRQFLRLIQRQPKWFVVQELKRRQFCCLSYKYLVVAEKTDLRVVPKLKALSVPESFRNYSKNRDKKRDRKKVVRIDEKELAEYFDVEKLLSEIKQPLDTFKDELGKHSVLKSSLGAIENIKITLADKVYKLQDLAKVGKKNQRLVVLDFASFPSAIPTVMKVLQKSELNINVQQDGSKVFVTIPKVTKEHREVLAKKCKLHFLKCKESIRDVQMKYIKSLGNIEKLSADDKVRLTDQLTALANKHISLAEEIMKEKQNELLKVDETTKG